MAVTIEKEESFVDEAEGVKGDAVLGEDREEGIGRIVKKSGGHQTTGGGNEGWRSTLCCFASLNESAEEDARGRMMDLNCRIGMDVDVVKIAVCSVKKSLPQRSKRQIRIS